MYMIPLFSVLILATICSSSLTSDEVRPPTSIEALESSCKSQTENFKCIKEGTKTLPAILKRGLLTFVQSRQRFHKKYCTNTQSNQSKKLIQDFKCIIEKKLLVYQKIEVDNAKDVDKLVRRNFNDPKVELKYFCCGILSYRKSIIDNVGPECSSSKTSMEEMINSIIPSETSLLCDDEEKLLEKVCPTLEPLKVSGTNKHVATHEAPISILYLLATLGEPDETLMTQ